jgi:hypothetical protein
MEFIQIIRQLFFDEKLGLIPFVTFDRPLTIAELSASWDSDHLINAIIDNARQVLEQHQVLLSENPILNLLPNAE